MQRTALELLARPSSRTLLLQNATIPDYSAVPCSAAPYEMPLMSDRAASFESVLEEVPTGATTRRRVWVLIPFGYEMDMLLTHMGVLAPSVDGFLVSESTHSYEGEEPKRALLTELMARDGLPPELKGKVTARVLSWEASGCNGTKLPDRAEWCMEHAQRFALLEMVRAAASDGDLAIYADTDEIAAPSAVDLLRRCYPFGSGTGRSGADLTGSMMRLVATRYVYGFHCVDQVPWHDGPRAISVRWLRAQHNMTGKEFTNLRMSKEYSVPGLRGAGWHLSYFGGAESILYKLNNWCKRWHSNTLTLPALCTSHRARSSLAAAGATATCFWTRRRGRCVRQTSDQRSRTPACASCVCTSHIFAG